MIILILFGYFDSTTRKKYKLACDEQMQAIYILESRCFMDCCFSDYLQHSNSLTFLLNVAIQE